jgi:hypothetical protein
MKMNPDLLFWMTKPEQALQKRINDQTSPNMMNSSEQKLRDHIVTLHDVINDYISSMEESLIMINDTLTGSITPPEESSPKYASRGVRASKKESNNSLCIHGARMSKAPDLPDTDKHKISVISPNAQQKEEARIRNLKPHGRKMHGR